MPPRSFADLFGVAKGQTNGQTNGDTPIPPELLVFNAFSTLLQRGSFFRGADPRRSIEDECGHPREAWTAQQYQEWYDFNAIAARTVECWPDECWQTQPSVYEDEDIETLSSFERAWNELGLGLQGETTLYQDEECHPVWGYFHQVDTLMGISRYGALLLGLDDGEDLVLPAQPASGRKLLYLRAFSEANAAISEVEDDPSSPRYLQPRYYDVNLASTSGSAVSKVHWSRVLHCSESDLYHTPRMQQVRPQILDLEKLYGGSAEMYWKGAFPGHFFQTLPSLAGNVSIDGDDLKAAYERFVNGLERAMVLENLDVKTVAPQVVDPTPQIERQLEALCIRLNFPKRIFLGSERGELSSAQDQRAHDRRVRRRQTGILTHRLIVPFVGRLIALGVLPAPARFGVWWPAVDAQGETEKADRAVKLSQALAQYVSSGANQVLPLADFLVKILGWTEEEAKEVSESLPEETMTPADEPPLDQPAPTSMNPSEDS